MATVQKKKAIVRFKQDHLNEIYQPTKMQFSFVSAPKDGSRQCHSLAQCRDFLHDAAKAQLTKGSCSIYGFKYAAGSNPAVDLKKMRMLVTKAGLTKDGLKAFEEKMKRAIKLLHHYEGIAGWTKSTLSKVRTDKPEDNMWLFVGPVGWMKAPSLVSMYTFLIRLGDKDIGEYKTTKDLVARFENLTKTFKGSDNDVSYLRACFDKMHLVIKHRTKLFTPVAKTNFFKCELGTLHNNGGIFKLCSYMSPDKDLNNRLKKLHQAEAKKNGKGKK